MDTTSQGLLYLVKSGNFMDGATGFLRGSIFYAMTFTISYTIAKGAAGFDVSQACRRSNLSHNSSYFLPPVSPHGASSCPVLDFKSEAASSAERVSLGTEAFPYRNPCSRPTLRF
jgi:hypothetical protein